MHATSLVTPEVGFVLVFGLALFIVVYRLIFRKPKR
ncbi:hypothetical protein BH09BAC3_BH09BAC3_34740 [soil metagenome]